MYLLYFIWMEDVYSNLSDMVHGADSVLFFDQFTFFLISRLAGVLIPLWLGYIVDNDGVSVQFDVSRALAVCSRLVGFDLCSVSILISDVFHNPFDALSVFVTVASGHPTTGIPGFLSESGCSKIVVAVVAELVGLRRVLDFVWFVSLWGGILGYRHANDGQQHKNLSDHDD